MPTTRRQSVVFMVSLLGFLAVSVPLAAQQSAISGTVTDGGSGQALPDVQVQVLSSGGESSGSFTNLAGEFRVPVAPGTYTVIATMIGYTTRSFEGVQVMAATTASIGIALASTAIALDPVQVTVGKKLEKTTDAPAMVAVVSKAKIGEKIVATPIEHMKDVVGVDIINYGLSSGNVVIRGFNNIFSGAVHFLTDHRIASIPSLQVNLMHFVPSTDEDIARMEVVLGPGAALYGPNTANGVVHLITRSPLEGASTTVSIGGGERDVFKGSFRTSQLINQNFGIKLSGSLFRGQEWPYTDPTEAAAVAEAAADPAAFAQQYGISLDDVARVGQRDYDLLRWGGEARVDWRFAENGTAIFQVGRSSNTGIELTAIGAGQPDDWMYSFYQARVNFGRLFAQAYLNVSDGKSFLLQRGASIVDKSKMWVTQLQHGLTAADERLDLIYGLDYRKTTPESEGTIYGRYEGDDEITELGAYAQAEFDIADMWSLVGALRFDDTSVLEDPVWSPRAALVFTPAEQQTLRLTYNRAFNTPTTLNMFLDINGGRAPSTLGALGYLSRATGPGENGLSFQNTDGTFRGMRSTFSGAPEQVQNVTAQNLWSNAVNFLAAVGVIPPAQAPVFRGFDASQVSILSFDAVTNQITPLAETTVSDVPRMEASNVTTIELGYQGVIGNRVALAASVWTSKRENFTSPLTLWTPLLLLEGTQLAGMLIANGVPQVQAAAIAQNVGPVPLGVITDPDVETLGSDLIATYVNYGELDLWGADFSVTAFLGDEWLLGATGSLVSDDFFEPILNGIPQIIALNAPDKKGTVTFGYRGLSNGFMGEARARFTSGFPANSANFVGTRCIGGTGVLVEDCVEPATLFDLTLGYRIPKTGATAQLYVSNLLDADYRNFVGVPSIGRLALLQLKYEL